MQVTVRGASGGGRTRTAVGRTNAPSRSESRAGDSTARGGPLGEGHGDVYLKQSAELREAYRLRRRRRPSPRVWATAPVKALPEEVRLVKALPKEVRPVQDRTTVGRTNAPSRSESRAGDSTEAAPGPRTPQFGGYDSPKPEGYVDELMPPTPDFAEPEKVVESNMTALKRCRHKLNVHNGGAKKFFLNWNTKHDGNLSRGEMYQGFNHLNLDFTAAQADFLVRAFDADQSNSVEYHEFCKTMEMTDDDILAAVGAFSHFKPPPWIKPKGWEFNPYELNKIKRTQMLIQERMHQTFGGNPQDIRDAFLYMDKSRSGALSKDDFLKAFKRIGVDVKPHELELMLGHLDNKDQNHKIPYTNFVKNFEAQPAGSFNPFRPTERVPGTEHVTKEQLDSTGAPLSVQRKWNDSYGRDPRYRVSFPEVYHARLRPGSCAPDFSDNPDFKLVDQWYKSGKTIGREISTLPSNKPIPPQESAQYRLRASRVFDLSLPSVASHAGNKTKEDLIREREARFRLKQSTLQRSRAQAQVMDG